MTFVANSQLKAMQLHEHLGAGAFGTVFRATDSLLARGCAIKFVKNTDPQLFKAHIEGQVLQKCQHKNVVPVYGVDIYQVGGEYFAGIEMEMVPGGSAESALKSRFLSIRDVTKLGIDVLFALEHTHRNGVLHRDIKPANIMIGDTGAKLSDFGLAAAPGIGADASAAGSPVYNAPEVHTNHVTNTLTDFFSVGMSLFQLYNNYKDSDFQAGISSFSTIESGDTIKKMGYQPFVPRRVRTICNKACSKDPLNRYQTALEFRQALEGLRVRVDWRRAASTSWEGHEYGRKYSMDVLPQKHAHANVFKQNDRRVTARCTVHATSQLAMQEQSKIVYSTTFGVA
jgi:serine/threonine-protein kinase